MTGDPAPVLAAYIPSAQGRAALTHGIEEALRRGTRLVVLNVSRGDAYVDARFASKDETEHVEQQLTDSGVAHEWRQIVGSDPVDAILDAVTELDPSVLVIGLRRRSATGKLLMGSIAQQLLLNVPCPVLGVKA